MKNEIKRAINEVTETAKAVADMRHPSIEKLLRGEGYEYEADKIKALIEASDELSNLRANNGIT